MRKLIYTDAMASDGVQNVYHADTISFATLTAKPFFGAFGGDFPGRKGEMR